MLDLQAQVANALRTARLLGVAGPVTITRPAGTVINPTTNVASGAELVQTVTAAELKGVAYTRRGGAWSVASAIVMVASKDLTFTPEVGDTAVWAGETLTVLDRVSQAPDGFAPVLWELALGGQ